MRKRVAIIGGGFAAMAAAWDLTSRQTDSKDDSGPCDVTIFQMGGRLGGKAASSRNTVRGDRIEEHGLHLWLGYYENGFRMVRTCFEELKKLRSSDPELQAHLRGKPFDDWDWLAAFERANLVGLAHLSKGELKPWIARFPEYVWGGKDGKSGENGVTGIYQLPDGTALPGVHVVTDRTRAYPGEPPVVSRDCADGEDECLEKPDVAFFLTHALRELQAFVESLQLRVDHLHARGDTPPPDDAEQLLSLELDLNPITQSETFDKLMSDIPRALRMIRLSILVPAIQGIATLARLGEGPVPFVRNQLVALLDRFIDDMREKIEESLQGDSESQRLWELIDLLAANIRGIVASGLEGADDFSRLDEQNYQDWLRDNRIADRTLRSPFLVAAHDMGFAYYRGNVRDPQMAAGQAINAACRFFFMYKGALFWRMKAGTGEVAFAPMYLALRSRGVKFRFFHRLDDIELSPGSQPGTHRVSKLRFRRQVKLKVTDPDAPTNYEPLTSVVAKGRTIPSWPGRPLDAQFDFDAATRRAYEAAVTGADQNTYVNFESIWCNWPHGHDVFATVGGKHDPANETDPSWLDHFDEVVVTVPVAALGRVSKRLAAAQCHAGRRWRTMLDSIATVSTQSTQLWVKRSARELGWKHGQVTFSAFVKPFDTWADLSQLIAVENHATDVRGIHYFCSVLPDRDVPAIAHPGHTDEALANVRALLAALAQVNALVKENTRRFLNDWMFILWPLAVVRYPNIFKWEYLFDASNRVGERRLDAQHFVANVDPSERYTLSLPGTTARRIRPDDTGFEHLSIAGDWTDSSLNLGCLEAAVISGRLASSGIRGYPKKCLIPGFIGPTTHVAAAGGR